MCHHRQVVNALVITGPSVSDWREQPVGSDLHSLQGLVGGYVEILHRKEYSVAVNEDGLGEGLTPMVANTAATTFGRIATGAMLVGPVVVFGPRDGSALTALGPAARAAFERDYAPFATFANDRALILVPAGGQAAMER